MAIVRFFRFGLIITLTFTSTLNRISLPHAKATNFSKYNSEIPSKEINLEGSKSDPINLLRLNNELTRILLIQHIQPR